MRRRGRRRAILGIGKVKVVVHAVGHDLGTPVVGSEASGSEIGWAHGSTCLNTTLGLLLVVCRRTGALVDIELIGRSTRAMVQSDRSSRG